MAGENIRLVGGEFRLHLLLVHFHGLVLVLKTVDLVGEEGDGLVVLLHRAVQVLTQSGVGLEQVATALLVLPVLSLVVLQRGNHYLSPTDLARR